MKTSAVKKKTLILHVGIDKTGSTALQRFFRDNESELAQRGLLYLKKGRGGSWNHHKIFSQTNSDDYDSWSDLVTELFEAPQHTGLISFEGFYHFKEDQLLRIARYLSDVDVRVVIYLRRQSDMVRSGVAQRIKQGSNHLPLAAYDAEQLALIAQDYRPVLNRFSKVFGNENIVVRRYEHSRWPENSLFLDCLSAIGIKMTGSELTKAFDILSYDPNPSLDVDAIHLFDCLDRLGVDPELRRIAVRYMLTKMQGLATTFVSDLLSEQVDAKFHAANQEIARAWFGEEELFVEPSRFVYQHPDEPRIAEYFLKLRRFLQWREMPQWPGKSDTPKNLMESGRLRVTGPWGLSQGVLVVNCSVITFVFRTAIPENKSLVLELTARWDGADGHVKAAVNGHFLYEGSEPSLTIHIPGRLREARAQVVELQLSFGVGESAGYPKYYLEAMSYRVD